MRDALVSFLTLSFLCLVMWACLSVAAVAVSITSPFLPSSLAWFSIGFATAVTKPWKHLHHVTVNAWKFLDERIPR